VPPVRLAFDFLRPQRALRQPNRWLGALLLAAGLAALLASMDRYQSEVADVEALESRVERLRARQVHVKAASSQPVPAAVQAGLRQAGLAAGQLAVPWERLWRAIEESRGDDIALLSIALDPARGDIGLSGEARSFPVLSAFADALAEHGAFERVTLTQHKLSDGSPPVVVRFELRLAWRAPAGEAGS